MSILRFLPMVSRTHSPRRMPALTTKHWKSRQQPITTRTFSSFYRISVQRSTIDETIEEIQEQYAAAKDEFEIAAEETEKMTTYAQSDRDAAREELNILKAMFDKAVSDPETGDEVKSRIGQRIRELDTAVKNLEELAQNQD